jgi:hypothetical protein
VRLSAPSQFSRKTFRITQWLWASRMAHRSADSLSEAPGGSLMGMGAFSIGLGTK